MKLLIFLTSHRQTWEIQEFGNLLDRSAKMRDVACFMHCNYPVVFNHALKNSLSFVGRRDFSIFLTHKNTGYSYGHIEAIVDYFIYLMPYDLVVHCHPDVFLIEPDNIFDILCNFYSSPDMEDFLVSPMRAWDTPTSSGFCTDFFAFRPRQEIAYALARYSEEPFRSLKHPEKFLQRQIQECGFKYQILARTQWMGRGPRFIENVGIWHEHDRNRYNFFRALSKLEKLFGNRKFLTQSFYWDSSAETSQSGGAGT